MKLRFTQIVANRLGGLWSWIQTPSPLGEEALSNYYAEPLRPPTEGLNVFHLGHSLVGRDIPAMLQQLAGATHRYDVQLGWGTPLKAHWHGSPINGFEKENAHPRFRAATEALDSGQYDACVLTEMVEIRDAITYFGSADYLHRWAVRAWKSRPATRVYLYETWHFLNDPEGWLERLDKDLTRYWERQILWRALAYPDMLQPIYLIPAGQVLAQFVRNIEALGGVDGLERREDLFAKDDSGKQDLVHLSDLGSYLVALTHYSVLYHRSPIGLPFQLQRADGGAAVAPSRSAAELMQETVWQTLRRVPRTGLSSTVF